MSDLVAIAYEDLRTAQQVASNLGEAAKGHDIELDDVVIVERRAGRRREAASALARGLGSGKRRLWARSGEA